MRHRCRNGAVQALPCVVRSVVSGGEKEFLTSMTRAAAGMSGSCHLEKGRPSSREGGPSSSRSADKRDDCWRGLSITWLLFDESSESKALPGCKRTVSADLSHIRSSITHVSVRDELQV